MHVFVNKYDCWQMLCVYLCVCGLWCCRHQARLFCSLCQNEIVNSVIITVVV